MERLIETLPEAFLSGIPTNEPDAYVVVMEEAGDAVALNLANTLREHGLTVSVDLSGRGLKRQLRAASEANARFAVLLGPNEITRGEATVKNLETGEQKAVKLDGLPEAVAAEGGDRT
jgi:histidyl-tRNA synthetase